MSVAGISTRPVNALDLPRNEMAFRRRYQNLLLARKITTVFRPGDRIHPNWRGYVEGETVTARVIEQIGSDELGVPPLFNSIRIPIKIVKLDVKPIDSLGPEDFHGSSPDVTNSGSLESHLIGIYGKSVGEFGGQVTRIQFSYDT